MKIMIHVANPVQASMVTTHSMIVSMGASGGLGNAWGGGYDTLRIIPTNARRIHEGTAFGGWG